MNCKVMKCTSEATMINQFQLPYADAPIHKVPLCGLHVELIMRGAEYLYQPSVDTPGGASLDGQILMGDDLLGTHEFVVKDVRPVVGTMRFANDDDLGPVFELVVRRRGESHDSSISLVFRGDSGPTLVRRMKFAGLADEDPS